jgi:hypothetical protein
VTQRAPQSCQRCSFKKMRCSKTVPCQACINQGLAVQCRRETVIVSKQTRSVNKSRRQRAARQPAGATPLTLSPDDANTSANAQRRTAVTTTLVGGLLHDEIGSSRLSPDHEATAAMLVNFAQQPFDGQPDVSANDSCDAAMAAAASITPPVPATAPSANWNQPWSRLPDPETPSPSSTQEGVSPFETTVSALEYLVWGRQQEGTVSGGATVSSDDMSEGNKTVVTHTQAGEIVEYHARWLSWTHNLIHWPKFRQECRSFWEHGTAVDKAWLSLYYAVQAVSQLYMVVLLHHLSTGTR